VLELALYTPELPLGFYYHAILPDKSRAYELLLAASGSISIVVEDAGTGHVMDGRLSHNSYYKSAICSTITRIRKATSREMLLFRMGCNVTPRKPLSLVIGAGANFLEVWRMVADFI
jgi:hypothetical protein